MEQIKRFLEEDLQTAVQRLAIARQEGQSEESILQLYQTSVQYANLLQMLDQPAVPNQGRSEQPVVEARDDGAAALDRACKEFKAEWKRLWTHPSKYEHSKCS